MLANVGPRLLAFVAVAMIALSTMGSAHAQSLDSADVPDVANTDDDAPATGVTQLMLVAAVPLAPAPAPAPAAPRVDGPVGRVLDLVNQVRAQAGLNPVVWSPALGQSAQRYSDVLASTTCFDHTCGPVPDPGQRISSAGYNWSWWGENIAGGQQTPEAVMNAWMNSPHHRDNILKPEFRELGVGLSRGGVYGIYWTQDFGTPR